MPGEGANRYRGLDGYRLAIGRSRREVMTPALVLDAAIMRRNVETMADWARSRVSVRPHAKTHKCVEIARAQVAAGSPGVTAATVWEALAMLGGGIDSVLIANEIVSAEKIRLVAEAARSADLIVAVDDRSNADALDAAAREAGAMLGVLIEVDVGLHRGGVRSVDAARRLATHVTSLPGLRLRGMMGYEGHVVTRPERAARVHGVGEAMASLVAYVEGVRSDGHEVAVVSAGATNTFDMTGVHPGVTELQAGTYPLMDATYGALTPTFLPALTIAASVVSRHGEHAVLDCGAKTVALDLGPPVPRDGSWSVYEVHEEHTVLEVPAGGGPRLGEVVELVVPYCGGAVNLHDAYHVVEEDVVVDVWPIVARGAGRGA